MSGGTDLLRMTGEALYGARWQTPIAHDLGVTPRSVRHWCAMKHDCPDDIAERLLPLVVKRGEALRQLAEALRVNGDE